MWEVSPWQLFLMGGPMMWPILLCSVISLAIIFERLFFFRSIQEDFVLLNNSIFSAVRNNDIKAALKICDNSHSPMANVLKAGLLKYGRSQEEIVFAMEEASQFEVSLIEARLPALSILGNVTPLIGVLGTVLGLCVVFHTIQVRAIAMNPASAMDVAGGMWQALIATVAGLLVSIPAVLAYSYFFLRQNDYVRHMEKAALGLTRFLTSMSNIPGDV